MRGGLSKAISLGWEKLVVESDAVHMLNEVNDQASFSLDNPIADQVRSVRSRVWEVVFQQYNRNANRVAHELARVCFRNSIHLLFSCAIPICIAKVVLVDLQVL